MTGTALLNPRQQNFATELMKSPDGDVTNAYRTVYGDVKGAKQSAHKLLKHPKLAEWVAHQARILEQRAAYDLQKAHEDLLAGQQQAKNASEWLRATELLMRLHGLTKQTKVVNSVAKRVTAADIEGLSDKQLVQFIGTKRLQVLAKI